MSTYGCDNSAGTSVNTTSPASAPTGATCRPSLSSVRHSTTSHTGPHHSNEPLRVTSQNPPSSDDTESQFRTFTAVRWSIPLRTAHLPTGIHHDAEDLCATRPVSREEAAQLAQLAHGPSRRQKTLPVRKIGSYPSPNPIDSLSAGSRRRRSGRCAARE
ncbi:hypothetical protein J2S50_003905 [Streptomyces sp. DSM 40167]|nr:hypothetical protein [Streptomyces sp. DSM 40167]